MDFPQKFRPEKHGTPENIGDQRRNGTLKTEKMVFLRRIGPNAVQQKTVIPKRKTAMNHSATALKAREQLKSFLGELSEEDVLSDKTNIQYT
jgi:hypothetical protein